jgi:hypothetical protein
MAMGEEGTVSICKRDGLRSSLSARHFKSETEAKGIPLKCHLKIKAKRKTILKVVPASEEYCLIFPPICYRSLSKYRQVFPFHLDNVSIIFCLLTA